MGADVMAYVHPPCAGELQNCLATLRDYVAKYMSCWPGEHFFSGTVRRIMWFRIGKVNAYEIA